MVARSRYHRNQSRLYRIKSPAQLCSVLNISIEQLSLLLTAKDNYIRWTDKESGRPIQQPKPLLDRVHRRVAALLARIETPDFLHSAVQGRSYITNAENHDPDQPTIKIDIKKFYPSARAQAIYHFFFDRMGCDGDVSGILAYLLTVDGHLATGSSVSPILSFFAYEDMFLEVFDVARTNHCHMTCYVDDMVITGPAATRKLLRDVVVVVKTYRLRAHKMKVFKAGQPKVVTGVAVTRAGRRLPNKRQKQIASDIAALNHAKTDSERLGIFRTLTGRLFEAAQVDPAWRPKAELFSRDNRNLVRRMKKGAS